MGDLARCSKLHAGQNIDIFSGKSESRLLQGVAALLADRDCDNLLVLVAPEEFMRFLQNVSVEGSCEAAFSGQYKNQNILLPAPGEERVLRLIDARHDRTQHPGKLPGVPTRREGRLLRTTQPRRSDELHRPGNLLRVLHRAYAAPKIEKCGHR